ncbi:MAG: mechanosensitive ion channel protein MscS [Desulfuromonas sp.]|uniref:mechanosensitive ion channel family protein n=1 Tax=Desulfuromonas sp. TaxID=892 RepID=UPI000CBA4CB0|nr:mechanosensitive ion channel domain-containing protein [Desulfuromonas sp.]PLX85690.1 MAG: mechanosensitive ion channel protein MscS [Desulfuromonas sp.]
MAVQSALGGGGWGALLESFGLIFAAVAAGWVLYYFLFRVLGRFAARSDTALDNTLVRRWQGPASLLLPLLGILLVAPALRLPPGFLGIFRNLFSIALIGGIAWLLAGTVFALRDLVLIRFDMKVRDNLKARAVHTQVNVLVKVALVVIFIVAGASMLMTFEKVRQVGFSILASAGIAGIIVGFAAQRSIATLLAGIQIAATQPIRLDDVVIVEGEWGRIEEITLTYVVVRVWDLRRLVLPITYFLEKPFQNWTRVSADILGTVFLYTDYTVPVDAVREELRRIVEESDAWDGKVCGLQVTNASERSMELRCLVSAVDASLAWDLRCEVREKMLAFLQREYPESLPRVRAELAGAEPMQSPA